jgi:hypothetical protein
MDGIFQKTFDTPERAEPLKTVPWNPLAFERVEAPTSKSVESL